MRRLAVAVCVLLAASAAPALARPLADPPPCTTTFTDGAGTELWGDGGNWSTGVPPGAADDACIPLGFPIVFLTAATAVHSLAAPSASLAVSADLAVGAGGGTVAGLNIADGTVSGPLTAGTVNLRHGALAGTLATGVLRWSGGTLDAAATVGQQADLAGELAGGGALRIAQGATAHVAADTALAVPLDDDGELSVDGGVLTLTGGADSGSGTYAVAAGATLDWHAGTYSLASPAVTGSGIARLSGTARLAVSGAAAFARLDWSGGTLAGTGTTTAGTLNLSGDAGKTLADGTLVLTGASVLDGGGTLELDGTARLVNRGVLDARDDLAVTAGSGATPLVTNAAGATLRKSAGTGATGFAVPVDNDGLLDAESGTLRLAAGSGFGQVSTGTYTVAAGARLNWSDGAFALAAPSVAGAGTALVSGANTSLTVTGAARADATLAVGGGVAQFAGGLTAGTASLGGGTLTGAGLTLGRLLWSAGTLSGTATAGALTLSGTASLPDGTLTLTGDSTVDGTLRGAGAVVNDGTLHATSATIDVPLTNHGTVRVDSGRLDLAALTNFDAGSRTLTGGTYDLAGTLAVPGLAVAANAATIRLHGAGALGDGLAALTANAGTLELSDGASLAAGALVNSGTLRLADARLTLDSYTQTAAGVLAEALSGGVLAVRGAAVLGGTLAFDRGAAAPGDGARLPVIAYGSLQGSWATLTVTPLAGFSFRVAYDADAAALTVRRDPLPVPPAPTPTPTVTATVEPAATPTVVPGVRSVAAADSGTVLVQQPGAASTFAPLKGTASLPVGSVIDARKGQVTLTTASSFAPGATRPPTTLSVAAGIFRIRQVRATDGRTAVTDVLVRTPPGAGRACLPPHKGVTRTLKRAHRPRVSHRTIRRVRVVAKGVVRAFGKVAVLSTRNATFELRDRCDGTSAHVSQGRANLFDRIRGRTARLRAHRTAIVRARLFAARRLHLKKVPRPRP